MIPDVSEHTWAAGFEKNEWPYNKNKLKDVVYGTDRPSLQLETEKGLTAARIACQNLGRIEQRFPFGFGTMAAMLRRL